MNCADVQSLLTPHVDGELDLVRSLEVERHLRECPQCARLSERLQTLRTLTASEDLRYKAPPGLKERIRSNLPAPAGSRRFRVHLLAAAAVVLVALAGWGAVRLWPGSDAGSLTREVVANHVRSLMADHIVDVRSSDQHRVKPWFQGRLALAPPVPELADLGFPLVGGRLDYLGEQQVAALVYRRRDHVINVFVSPNLAPARADPEGEQWRGYRVLRWSGGGMTWWAVSDLNEKELQDFVKEFRARAGAPAPAAAR